LACTEELGTRTLLVVPVQCSGKSYTFSKLKHNNVLINTKAHSSITRKDEKVQISKRPKYATKRDKKLATWHNGHRNCLRSGRSRVWYIFIPTQPQSAPKDLRTCGWVGLFRNFVDFVMSKKWKFGFLSGRHFVECSTKCLFGNMKFGHMSFGNLGFGNSGFEIKTSTTLILNYPLKMAKAWTATESVRMWRKAVISAAPGWPGEHHYLFTTFVLICFCLFIISYHLFLFVY
jgi:hypothetical protein